MSGRNRRRRRRQDRAPVPARLLLDDHMKGDVGCFSQDLAAELFPHLSRDTDKDTGETFHVAIAPWTSNASPSETSWSIVPVTTSPALGQATIQFSPSSSTLQTFALHLQDAAPSKLSGHGRNGIEITVLDAIALPLSTVFVSLEGELTKRLENGEGTFYRHRPTSAARTSPDATPEDKLVASLRHALGGLKIAHTGDLFPLPLPPHPITHVPPSPGKIVLCEPVAQGVLSATTKIVVMRGRGHVKKSRGTTSLARSQALNGVREDDEDTANDQFYSAAEERYRTDATLEESESVTESETDLSGIDHDAESSEDSMDEMISLEAPTLHATSASGVSTMQPGTPTLGRGRKTNGVSTPGSVFSNFTATTARPDRPRGRLFKAQGLMRPVSTEVLHPKPSAEDDEEARIYVDIASLPKIGCFSGDWVRVEVSEEPPTNGFGAFGLGSLSVLEGESANWRPVRVYGLPHGLSGRPITRIPTSRTNGRAASFFESQIPRTTTPSVLLSPILWANLESASYLRVSPLKRGPYQGKGTLPKFTSAARPPYARDISIHHIQSQVSVDRIYQTAVLGGLKHYFSEKLRLVRTGDLVAVPIDSKMGRAMQESPGSVSTSEVDDLMSLTSVSRAGSQSSAQTDHVAWFKVGHIQVQRVEGDDEAQLNEMWGSVACFDSSSVRMHGSGSEKSKVPGTKVNPWQYYLGLKKFPRRQPEALAAPAEDQSYVSPCRRKLRELLAVATSPRTIGLKIRPIAIVLNSDHRSVGKMTLALDACADVGLHAYTIDANDILSEGDGGGTDVKTQGYLKARSDRALSCGSSCCALVIRHLDAISGDRTAGTLKDILDDARVIIATTNGVEKLPDAVRGLFTHELEVGAPDESEREAILRSVVDKRGIALDPAVDLNTVALKTAALVAGDLVDVVERALIAQRSRLEDLCGQLSLPDAPVAIQDLQVAGGTAATRLTKADLDVAVDAARKNFSDSIGAPKIPNVSWDDVGGLSNVKEAITETIQLPLERPELFAKGLKKRSGILFYGPPGTGKTLLAKAIATEYSLNFFSVKGPELLNMYVGESEANVRRVFQRARDARPCVVFFDELDSVAPKRGNQGDSGGVMDRIVSQLLAELDGMSGGEDTAGGVFVIGATNRPDLLDPALLRPGRFDKMLYLGVSDTNEKQVKILEALTRKFDLDPLVSLSAIAQRLPFTYTGADFYALCSDAMLKAVTRQAGLVDAKIRAINADRAAEGKPPLSTAAFFDQHAAQEDVAVLVTEEDFASAQRDLVPSVSAGELAHYEKVRASFEGGRDANGARRSLAGLVKQQPEAPGGSQKGRGKASAAAPGKGKGKAVATAEDDVDSDDEAAAEMRRRAKGKGKAIAGFQDGTASDDDGLY